MHLYTVGKILNVSFKGLIAVKSKQFVKKMNFYYACYL